MKTTKPRIFIGSSVEGLRIAQHIQVGLDYHAECTLWSQGVFGLSMGTLESLCNSVHHFDFAILVLTPDDLVQKRAQARSSPRDNVLFELGLFMGALGRERTFMVYCRDIAIDLPTDLAGVTAVTFAQRSDGNLQAALGPVCTKLEVAMEGQRNLRPGPSPGSAPDVGERLMSELASLKQDVAAQADAIRQMMASVTSGATPGQPAGARAASSVSDVAFLEGAWVSPESASTAYARVVDGRLRWAYCYCGNDHLTGEYYNMRLFDGALFSRFRWMNGMHSGYGYYRIESRDLLKGGWWPAADDAEPDVYNLPSIGGMHQTSWVRRVNVDIWPSWAEKFFSMLKSGKMS